MTIRLLADIPEAIPLLAGWFYNEWHKFDGRSLASIKAQLAENHSRDSIPITFLAQSGSKLLGTASIDLYDLPPFGHLSPWLASVYVLPSARGKGIGTALVRHAQQFAASCKINPLYLWTPGSTRLYENCGWKILQQTTCCSRPATLMQFTQ